MQGCQKALAMTGMPTLRTAMTLFATQQPFLEYIYDKGILDIPAACSNCGGRVAIYGSIAQCSTKCCRKAVSIYRTSFFANARIAPNEIMLLGYLWLSGCSYSSILTMTQHSSATIVDYLGHFRQLVVSSLEDSDTQIGGEGVIVEIDESKFGRRKYNRGKRVEGTWIIGGIERTERRRFFVKVVERRDSETIVDVLSHHILPKSVVYTDCWKGYTDIEEALDVVHETVNHSLHYKDPITGVHTNSVESMWSWLKRKISLRARARGAIDGHLLEQVWRKKHEGALWEGFIEGLRAVGY